MRNIYKQAIMLNPRPLLTLETQKRRKITPITQQTALLQFKTGNAHVNQNSTYRSIQKPFCNIQLPYPN